MNHDACVFCARVCVPSVELFHHCNLFFQSVKRQVLEINWGGLWGAMKERIRRE